ncbi:hypothetical protein JMG10_35590 [Nostoc ellipsosporum NOK]|nr:hypothetical protein [Nostoc ellipsosporum NOK]
MSTKDKNNPQQHPNTTEGNRRSWKGFIYLTVGLIIFTAVGASAITVVVLQKLGLIAGNSSTPSPSPTITSESSIPSPSATVSSTPSPVEVPTPVATTSSTPTNSSGTILQSSLINTDCQSATPGFQIENVLRKVNKSASIGGEVLPVVVEIGGYYDNVQAGKPFEAVCSLNNSFTELKLVFGVDGSNRYAVPENKLIFRVELDNKPVETQEVVVGKKYTANLNLQGVKNVKLRAECVNKDCPLLSISEMSLR